MSDFDCDSTVGLSELPSSASSLEREQRGSIKRTQVEWNRSLYFIGMDFETLQWNRAEDERLLHGIDYGSEWLSWRPPPSVSNLQNPVHQLFSRERFIVDTEDESLQDKLWDGLMPALQLSSRLLTSPPVLAFLNRIHYGREEELSHDGSQLQKIVLKRDYRPPLLKHVLKELLTLSTKVKYAFGAIKIKSWNPNQIHAIRSLSA